MNEAPKTIAELIWKSLENRNIGRGSTSTVFPIASPEFSHYIWRINSLHFRSFLMKYPEDAYLIFKNFFGHGFGGAHDHVIASAIAIGGGKISGLLQIQPREVGKSLPQCYMQFLTLLKRTMPHEQARSNAFAQTLETIAAVPQHEYEGLLNSMNWLSLLAAGPHGANNIMLSRSTLRFVDLLDTTEGPILNNLEALRRELLRPYPPWEAKLLKSIEEAGEQLRTRIHTAQAKITDKLEAAAGRTVIPTPRCENKVPSIIALHRPRIAFKPDSYVEDMKRISLSSAPWRLREELSKMEERLGLTFPRK